MYVNVHVYQRGKALMADVCPWRRRQTALALFPPSSRNVWCVYSRSVSEGRRRKREKTTGDSRENSRRNTPLRVDLSLPAAYVHPTPEGNQRQAAHATHLHTCAHTHVWFPSPPALYVYRHTSAARVMYLRTRIWPRVAGTNNVHRVHTSLRGRNVDIRR